LVWNLDKSRPIADQIVEQMCLKIAIGEMGPGDRVMSVRDTAALAGVNPNTVQKAFEKLETEGILFSQRGSGWFVCEDTSKAVDSLREVIRKKTAAYFEAMKALGLDSAEIKKYVEEWNEDE